jgi:hypothetical protein
MAASYFFPIGMVINDAIFSLEGMGCGASERDFYDVQLIRSATVLILAILLGNLARFSGSNRA